MLYYKFHTSHILLILEKGQSYVWIFKALYSKIIFSLLDWLFHKKSIYSEEQNDPSPRLSYLYSPLSIFFAFSYGPLKLYFSFSLSVSTLLFCLVLCLEYFDFALLIFWFLLSFFWIYCFVVSSNLHDMELIFSQKCSYWALYHLRTVFAHHSVHMILVWPEYTKYINKYLKFSF